MPSERTTKGTVLLSCEGHLWRWAYRCPSRQYKMTRLVQAWPQLSPRAGMSWLLLSRSPSIALPCVRSVTLVVT